MSASSSSSPSSAIGTSPSLPRRPHPPPAIHPMPNHSSTPRPCNILPILSSLLSLYPPSSDSMAAPSTSTYHLPASLLALTSPLLTIPGLVFPPCSSTDLVLAPLCRPTRFVLHCCSHLHLIVDTHATSLRLRSPSLCVPPIPILSRWTIPSSLDGTHLSLLSLAHSLLLLHRLSAFPAPLSHLVHLHLFSSKQLRAILKQPTNRL